jgi:hypothetical protein
MSLSRRLAAGLLLAAFAAGAATPHRHSLSADLYEDGGIRADHDHVLTSHDPLSRSTHFHAILGIEHDVCAACHGVRGLARPAAGPTFHTVSVAGRAFPRAAPRVRGDASRAASSRAPPASA